MKIKLAAFASTLLAMASLNGATITFGTNLPADFTNIAPVVRDGGALVADGTGFMAIGASTLTDAQIGDIGTDLAALAAFQGDFTQFGSSTTFGGAGVFNEPSLASFSTSQGTSAGDAFVGNNIFIIAGNGADLNSSTELFVYRLNETFGADAPLFATDVATFQAGTLAFGSVAPGISLPQAGTRNGYAMGTVAVVPEPTVALLGALGVLGLIRRRR